MKREIITDLIPTKSIFIGNEDKWDFESICVFVATGFFLDDSTYFNGQKTLKPGHKYCLENGKVSNKEEILKWSYNPRERNIESITDELINIVENKIKLIKSKDSRIILPLSGGLDSRSLAAVLGQKENTFAYSYSFKDGINENKYGELISKKQGYQFRQFQIGEGYLWNRIDNLSEINGCYSEFTHPRQMAISEYFTEMGNVFLLGHWGDVLFDNYDIRNNARDIDWQVDFLKNKIVKDGGVEFAEKLWLMWGLNGKFIDYFNSLLHKLLSEIEIDDLNAKMRAFKSIHWATRWTSIGLNVFEKFNNICVPYFSNEMCNFIMTVDERYLSKRFLQINAIKKLNTDLAEIPWQNYDPFNLYDYNKFTSNQYRIKRKLNSWMSKSKNSLVKRNWELQFLGENNKNYLMQNLFRNCNEIDNEIKTKVFNDFYQYSNSFNYHQISMLLTINQKFCMNKL